MEMDETVYQRKKAFIENQVRLLSASMILPLDWVERSEEHMEEGIQRIPKNAIASALHKLNTTNKKHIRLQYSTQGIHHAASQVDKLYRNRSLPNLRNKLYFKVSNLTREHVAESIPREWPTNAGKHNQEILQKYSRMVERLIKTTKMVAALRKREKEYRELYEKIKTLDDIQGVQDNLITRDSPIETELNKMTVLLAKTGSRVNALPPPDLEEDVSVGEMVTKMLNTT